MSYQEDNLLTVSKEHIADVLELCKQSWSLNRSNPRKAKELAEEALSNSKERGSKIGEAYAAGAIGAAQVWLAEYDKSLENLLQAHKSLRSFGELNEDIQILYMIAVLYELVGNRDKQRDFFEQAYETADEIGDLDGKAAALNGLGTYCYNTDQNEKAIETLSQALEICEEIGNDDIKIRVLDGLGQANYLLGNVDQALEFKHECLRIATQKDIKQVMSYALNGLGDIYRSINDFPQSIDYLEKARTVRAEMGFKTGEAQSIVSIAKTYAAAGDYLKAQAYLNDGLKMAEEIKSNEIAYACHLHLSEIFEKMGNMNGFATHYKAYHHFKELASKEKNEQKLKTLELESKIDKIEQEKHLLRTQNERIAQHYEDLKTLGQIGKEITSTLNLNEILETIYKKVNALMDANVFLIGLYDEEKEVISMEFAFEKGERLPHLELDINDPNRVACWVARNKQEAIINDMQEDMPKYTGKIAPPAIGESPESIIYLPILDGESLIGLISVQSFEKNAYNNLHLSLIRNLAVYAGIAIKNAQAFRSVEDVVKQRTQEVIKQRDLIEQSMENSRLLNKIGQELISTLNIQDVFKNLHTNVNQLMDASCFGIRLYNKERNVVEYKYEMERGTQHPYGEVSMDTENNYSVWCINNKETIYINDNSVDYVKYVNKVHVVSGDFPYSLIFQPLMKGDDIIGVITVQSFEKNAYDPYHVEVLKTLASYTTIALENAKMYEVLDEKVKERTKELSEQNKVIEQNAEELKKKSEDVILLSELGKKITSLLSINDINRAIYDSLNRVMDTPSFGIGIFDEEKETISFPGYIEKGKVLTGGSYHVSEVNRMAIACFNNDIEIVINDYYKEHSKFIKQDLAPQMGESVESLIYIPLHVKGKKIGVITVQSFKTNAYSDYQVNFLRNLAVYAAIAIDNARLYEGLEDLVEERTAEVRKQKEEIEISYKNTELLSKIGKDITSALSTELIISTVYENVNNLMDASCFGIGIYQKNDNRLVFPGFIENNEHMEEFYYAVDDDRLASVCFKNRQEIFINDYANQGLNYLKSIQTAVSGNLASSIMYLPVYSGQNEAIGVITVQTFEKNKYTEYHLNILRNLAVYVGIALENATLYENLEEKVKERTAEVITQKEIIEEKNKSITDSIKYAKRIQDATLPDASVISKYFNDAFILFKPKDIVSGDFYWFESVANEQSDKLEKVLFAVVDCTGHGVPGAFMSLIGSNALNQIVKEYKVNKPADILTKLDEIVSSTLSQNAEYSQIKDGMDLAICSYCPETQVLEYAGAYNPLWIIRDNEIMEIKADKIAIGLASLNTQQSFQNHEIKLQEGDEIYLFSDGFADQFGGAKGKKLKFSRFKEILSVKSSSMKEKHKALDQTFEEWRGDLEQLDDVCVIGIRA